MSCNKFLTKKYENWEKLFNHPLHLWVPFYKNKLIICCWSPIPRQSYFPFSLSGTIHVMREHSGVCSNWWITTKYPEEVTNTSVTTFHNGHSTVPCNYSKQLRTTVPTLHHTHVSMRRCGQTGGHPDHHWLWASCVATLSGQPSGYCCSPCSPRIRSRRTRSVGEMGRRRRRRRGQERTGETKETCWTLGWELRPKRSGWDTGTGSRTKGTGDTTRGRRWHRLRHRQTWEKQKHKAKYRQGNGISKIHYSSSHLYKTGEWVLHGKFKR